MEQITQNHSNLFQDYTYVKDNLVKQKEKLFARGKWSEWNLFQGETTPETSFIDSLLEDKELAFEHMLPDVNIILYNFILINHIK